MTFEEFVPKKAPPARDPMISILKQGSFGINGSAAARYFKDAEFVVMLYDKEGKRIGLRPVKEPTPNSYPLRRSKKGNSLQITGQKFLRHYEIAHPETKRYPCDWLENENLVVVQL